MRRGLLLGATIVLLAAVPASAEAADWTCEASALCAEVLTAPAIEPAVANRGAACREAGGGGAFARCRSACGPPR